MNTMLIISEVTGWSSQMFILEKSNSADGSIYNQCIHVVITEIIVIILYCWFFFLLTDGFRSKSADKLALNHILQCLN